MKTVIGSGCADRMPVAFRIVIKQVIYSNAHLQHLGFQELMTHKQITEHHIVVIKSRRADKSFILRRTRKSKSVEEYGTSNRSGEGRIFRYTDWTNISPRMPA